MKAAPAAFSLCAAAREAPDATAVVGADGPIAYRCLLEDVRRAASWLARHHDLSDRGIALLAAPTYRYLVTLHAAIALGIPVALLHPSWPETLQSEMVARCGGRLLTEAPAASAAPPFELGAAPPDDDRILAWVATSGTAGRPRWAALSRAALATAAAMSADNLGWQEEDRWLLSLRPAHVGGLAIVLRALAARRAIVLAQLDWSTPAAIVALLREKRVSLLSLVPAQLDRLLTVPERAPAGVRAALVGGAAATPDLLARARERGWPALATYGSTETCSQIATERFDVPAPLGSCGPPLPGVALRIDADGVIAVRGSTLMTGFLPLDGPQPIGPDGWLRTGDRGRLDGAGNVYVLGRADDVIVSGGENVDPLAVEAALTRHAGIADAMVFGLPDPTWGRTVAALLVAADDHLDGDALAGHLAEHLATYARPRRIAWIDAVPRTPIGKPDRRAGTRFVDRLLPLSSPKRAG